MIVYNLDILIVSPTKNWDENDSPLIIYPYVPLALMVVMGQFKMISRRGFKSESVSAASFIMSLRKATFAMP